MGCVDRKRGGVCLKMREREKKEESNKRKENRKVKVETVGES